MAGGYASWTSTAGGVGVALPGGGSQMCNSVGPTPARQFNEGEGGGGSIKQCKNYIEQAVVHGNRPAKLPCQSHLWCATLPSKLASWAGRGSSLPLLCELNNPLTHPNGLQGQHDTEEKRWSMPPLPPPKNPACLCLPISNIFCVRGGESSKQSPLIPLHAWWHQPSFGEWESTSTKRLTRPTQIADTNLYPDLSFQGPPLTHSSHRSRRPWNPFRHDKCRVARDSNNL